MHIVVVANGELPADHEAHVRAVLQSADHVIAADGGLAHCEVLGEWPQQVVGDLDSVPAEVLERARVAGVTVTEYPVDKDATDLELALDEAVTAGATRLTVVTPFGGRLDHELATIALLASQRWASLNVDATDGRRQLTVVRSTVNLSLAVGATLSLIPWAGDVTGVTTAGLQWPLNDETLALGTTRGVSNVATAATQSVSITSGVLLATTDAG